MVLAFGARVRDLRTAANLSEEQLAARCGFASYRSVTRIERATWREPTLCAIVQLCRGLEVTPNRLLGALVLVGPTTKVSANDDDGRAA